MASIQFADGLTSWKGEASSGAGRTVVVPRGDSYLIGAQTGTIAAALAANATVFGMRLDPGTTNRAYIDRLKVDWTTIVAFTTPVTAGRRLALFRGSGAATTGGTSLAEMVRGVSTAPASQFDVSEGGDVRVATTGALGVTGITFEAQPAAIMSLAHVGAAGNYVHYEFELEAPIVLEPGQIFVVRNGSAAMDAAGTWQLGVNVRWFEAPLLSA